MTQDPIVIVGSGMAGYTLAREIRKIDATVPVTLLTADDGTAYSKPMLSNALAQDKTPDALVQKSAQQMALELAIEIRTETPLTAIDRAQRTLALTAPGGRQTLSYGRLVLALGATPRPYGVLGGEDAPLFAVNSLADYRNWRAGLKGGDRVLIVGAGLIGVEFANDLALAGHPVTVVDPAPQPLGRLLPDSLGMVMADALTAAGITVLTGHSIASIAAAGEDGRQATLDNGRTVAFDCGLVAIGLLPRVDIARDAGLEVRQGIRVDSLLQTSDDAIFAIGDGAETDAGVLPFVLPLMAQARALAKTLTGTPAPLRLPALPVTVKTPALPVVVCPPKPGAAGAWSVDGEGRNRRALFAAADGTPLGFALTGEATKERMALAKAMPDLLVA